MAFKLLACTIVCLTIGCILLFSGCGSKQSPTGGKQDLDKLQVLASFPAEYDEISEQKIELTFSKSVDSSTFLKGVYIYPAVSHKKIIVDGNLVTVKFLEALQKDTNYYLTLTTRIKDIRGNTLDNNQTLIYRHGKLQTNKISGTISYEEPQDNGLPIQINLLSSDSLWVLSKSVKGQSYLLEGLNPMSYIMRAYIDKNLNGRYDANLEPYQEFDIAEQTIATYNLNMAYADTVKPAIKFIKAISNREYELILNKSIKSFQKISVQSANGKNNLQVFAMNREPDKITIITSQTDTTKWQFSITDVYDNKGNFNPLSSMVSSGSSKPDITPPVIVQSNPRSGATVNNLLPTLEITFSEIIPASMFKAMLKETDSGKEIPFKLIKSNQKTYQIQPEKPLENYKSCVLMVFDDTSDLSGNNLKQAYKLVFLPIVRTSK
jgi:methionine-rich copper-binding protein CopC